MSGKADSNKRDMLQKRALLALRDPVQVLRKLLAALDRRKPPASLPPAGRRSGEGSESLAPYLEEERSTKPGDLQ
jgi:hypothetical protein